MINALRLVGRYADWHRVLVVLGHDGITVDNRAGQNTLLTWQTIEAAGGDLLDVMSETIRTLANARDVK